jgi:hypothetical protein
MALVPKGVVWYLVYRYSVSHIFFALPISARRRYPHTTMCCTLLSATPTGTTECTEQHNIHYFQRFTILLHITENTLGLSGCRIFLAKSKMVSL